MGQKLLIDTNCVTDYLLNQLTAAANEIIETATLCISSIIRIEVLTWHDAPPVYDAVVGALLDNCIIYNLDEAVIAAAIIVRKARKIKLPDAIIAATALVHNIPVYTHNVKDFVQIEGLLVVDSHKL